ncbi:hypothetical protein [Yersinia mollaretii]|uniref:Uncharacterized protein n=1 Tax=Yersinia mollaretii TaxID=33060 RepID=A0AA36PDZ4_YERMO|nr:hypothetical protein [Yersinia mollaretii]MDA5526972.1 hypothetical protein [Yersinia mollaretii]MDA5534447.1 hypothetical protein [Yersinia mollaretii]MDR7872366.1 hypothetical protein [Yersinia mollaretii]WQC73126.1 hypothetical protein U1Z61_11570 [Yersinia mollaretii]CNE60194.1 Uncharacterised protein [Yersinia mollaretii]
MSDNDLDIIPFSEAKALLLADEATFAAYNEIQDRKTVMTELKDANKAIKQFG